MGVLASTEGATNTLIDAELFELAISLNRMMVTQDIRFRALAGEWQQVNRPFAALIFAHQRFVGFGDMVDPYKSTQVNAYESF